MSEFEAAQLREWELERITKLVVDLDNLDIWPSEVAEPLLRHIAYLVDDRERVMEERDTARDALAEKLRREPWLASKAKSALDEVKDLKMQMEDIRKALGIPPSAEILPAIQSLLTMRRAERAALGRKDGQ